MHQVSPNSCPIDAPSHVNNTKVSVRTATVQDLEIIYQFIMELASYEKLNPVQTGTMELFKQSLFPHTCTPIDSLHSHPSSPSSADSHSTRETHLSFIPNAPAAEVILASIDNENVGFALFYHNFSTCTGKRGLHLEDLYVRERYRRQGVGKALLSYLAALAKQRGCPRFEWNALKWNTNATQFYQDLGAEPLDEWIGFRLQGKGLDDLAAESCVQQQ